MHKLTLILAALLILGTGIVSAQYQVPPGACSTGQYLRYDGSTWSCTTPAGGGLPSGATVLVSSGSCPTGFSEDTALNGVMLVGTLAANGDVGTTGGSDTITPTVNSLTAAAQVFTGSSTTVPALGAGTLATAWPAGVPTFSGASSTDVVTHQHGLSWARGATTGGATTQQGFTSSQDTSSTAITQKVDAPAGAVASYTPTGTVAWPAGVPTVSGSTATGALTPLGSNASSAVTGTLNSFNNRPAFVKVIFCKAN